MQLQEIQSILLNFEKRAENKPDETITETFVDAQPLVTVVSAPLSQVIFGRRGTGKTHALKYVMSRAREAGDAAAFIDIRSVGSNGSFYADSSVPSVERGLRLVTDILFALHDELLRFALMRIGDALHPVEITKRVDDLSAAISEVKVLGDRHVEHESVSLKASEVSTDAKMGLTTSHLSGALSGSSKVSGASQETVTVRATETDKRSIDFGRTQAALDGLIKILGIKKFWLFIDEWSETPPEIQPFLADLIRKTILPVPNIVVKIAAIEQRSVFISPKMGGGYVGLELGADIAADLNLDEFMVFDFDQERASNFFRDLIYKNFVALGGDARAVSTSKSLSNALFTEKRAFEEFVRAVEGVPRDALNLISKCVMKSFGQQIGVDVVRKAALDWYQSDKVNVINSAPQLQAALNHIVDEVIGNRRARAFLFPSGLRHIVIDRLYDARVLHLLKKNISSRDEAGKRYDVWKIDYGCYVDLIRTQQVPLGLLPDANDNFVDVPTDDYRSIRRAVLTPDNLDSFMVSE